MTPNQYLGATGQTLSKIYYSKPSITELEVQYATDAAANGWGDHCFDYLNRFEKEFAQWLGVKHTVATTGATGALHMGLVALGIKPGDEVILGDITWIASAAPITYLGATPIFVDVLEDTWCLDPEKVEAAITPRTKAIMAVHLYGSIADMDALLEIGKRYGIPVVEDAAESMGSRWKGGQRTGTMGAFSAFSFHGSKTMTTGEGGMFATNDDQLAHTLKALNAHGRVPGQTKQFWADMIGYKYKMSNIQAALGCAQMQRLEQLIERRREIMRGYKSRLGDLPLALNTEPEGTINGYWMPTIVVNREVTKFDREALLNDMRAHNIDARVFFWPLTMLPMFSDKPENEVSYSLYKRAINLPSYHDLNSDEMDRVCTIIKRHL
jgi:perosamine synthetase